MSKDLPPTEPAQRLSAAVVAADRADRESMRWRRDLLTGPLYLVAALVVHAGVVLLILRLGGLAGEPREEEDAVFSVAMDRPQASDPPLAAEAVPPPPLPEELAPEPVAAAPSQPSAVPDVSADAFVADAAGAPGPLDERLPGPDIFGVGSGGGEGGGGGGGGGTGKRSGLAGGGGFAFDVGPGGSGFRGYVEELRARGLDVVFVVDCTASMQQYIDRVRATIDDIIGDLSAIVPDLRLGIVAYRDRTDPWVTQQVDLSDDRYRIHNFLLGLAAVGGGDFEEAVDEALRQAAEGIGWRPDSRRVIILVGDAPPHAADESAALAVVRGFARDQHSVVYVLFTGADADQKVEAKEKQARTSLEKIARTGNGTLADLRLDDESLRDLILDAAFGSEWQQDIRALLAHQRKDWRERIVRDRVKDRDQKWLLSELGREPVHPSVVDGCLQLFDRNVARRALELLLDESRPEAVRSMVLYILKRKLGTSLAFEVAQPVASQPDQVAKLRREVDKLPDAGGHAEPPPLPPPVPQPLPPPR